MSRIVCQILIAACVTMLVLSLSRADDRPRAPIPRAPLLSTPTGARSTSTTAASLQQVVRAPVSGARNVVYVVGSTSCYPCRLFKQKHGDGGDNLKYVYAYMDKPRPADSEIDVATWNELVKLNNSGRFVYPFFVVRLADGQFVGAQAKVE